MSEKTKGILLAGLIAVAALVWYLERRSDSVSRRPRRSLAI